MCFYLVCSGSLALSVFLLWLTMSTEIVTQTGPVLTFSWPNGLQACASSSERSDDASTAKPEVETTE